MAKAYKYIINNPGIVCAIMLLGLILYLPYMYLWDEDWYMKCIRIINKVGLTKSFIANDPAAPMHAVVYYLLTPITHGNPLIARLINYMMCFLICLFIYLIIKQSINNNNATYSYSLSLFAIPSFLVIGFFAITEAPCLLFYVISAYLLFMALKPVKFGAVLAILGGLFFAFAVLTRQLFLPVLLPVFIIIFYKRSTVQYMSAALFCITAIAVCAPVFYIWKGIVPAGSGIQHAATDLLTMKHWFLSFGYTFFYFLCIIPIYLYNFYKKHARWVLPLVAAGIICSLFVKNAEFLPMAGFLPRFFSLQTIDIIAHVYFITTCVLALLLVYFFIHEFIDNRNDFTQTFLLLSMFVILCTPVLISSQFSSRYPLQAAPLMLIFCYSRRQPVKTGLQTVIFLTCVAINFISVITFLY